MNAQARKGHGVVKIRCFYGRRCLIKVTEICSYSISAFYCKIFAMQGLGINGARGKINGPRKSGNQIRSHPLLARGDHRLLWTKVMGRWISSQGSTTIWVHFYQLTIHETEPSEQ